jgi:hypothetical protein
VVTTFNALGLDVGRRDLPASTKWFASQTVEGVHGRSFLAGLDYAVMTSNASCRRGRLLGAQPALPGRAENRPADRPALVNWPAAVRGDEGAEYKVKAAPDARRSLSPPLPGRLVKHRIVLRHDLGQTSPGPP